MSSSARLARWSAIALLVTSLSIIGTRLVLAGTFPADLAQFSPFSVYPEHLQSTLRALITIPIGIVALVAVRQFIGIQTLGTFMPVLIGVAFRLTGPLKGLMLFLSIMVIGILFRALFGKMRLLLIPRLASVLIVIVGVMVLITMLGVELNIDVGSTASLFPLVILAMTIERLVITWEESGPHTAISHLGGSLFVALLAYGCMTFPMVETGMFAFPETLLILLAASIMMGRYLGFRLTEYLRFKDVESDQ